MKNPFKKAVELVDVEVDYISLVTDEFKPINGKGIIIKAEGQKVVFKASKVIKGIAEGQYMIANEEDKQKEFYSFDTVQGTAIAVMKAVKDGKTNLFNKNHKSGALDGINIAEMSIDYVEKAWNGSIDFSENAEIMKAAEEDRFHGFSIEGLAGRITKASEPKGAVLFVKPIEELSALVKAILEDKTLTDVIKKGNIEVNVSQSFDLISKEIDSMFKIDSKNLNKAEDSEMDITKEQVAEIAKAAAKEAIDEFKKENEQDAINKATKKENEQLKKDVADLKKAQVNSDANPDEGDKKNLKKADDSDDGEHAHF